MEHDPYQIPSSDLSSAETYSGATNVTQRTITELAGTKPWVRLFAVLGFIASIAYIIIGIITVIAGMAGSTAAADLEEFSELSSPAAALTMGAIYLVVGIIYIIPTLKLWNFGSAIGRLKTTASVQDLESALSFQRSFWKFLGVMTLISFVLGVIAAIAVVAFAATQIAAP